MDIVVYGYCLLWKWNKNGLSIDPGDTQYVYIYMYKLEM